MELNKLLKKRNISQYRLSKISGIPQTTILDICADRTIIEKCSGITLLKISKCLGVSMEDLILKEIDCIPSIEFDVFKSNVCHINKSLSEDEFVRWIIESKQIETYFRNKEFAKSFYLLAFLDYVCDKEGIKKYDCFDSIRTHSLFDPQYPNGILLLDEIFNTNENKKKAYIEADPYFKKYNIIEKDVENVY